MFSVSHVSRNRFSRYCHRFLSLVCERRNWTRVPGCLVAFQCPYHVSCVRVVGWSWSSTPLCRFRHATLCVLASWACAWRASCGLAHLVPEISENSRVGVPTDHLSMPLFWHPDFRLTVLTPRRPRCTFHTLDETTVPDTLIILRSNRPFCVNTLCGSDNVLIALCGSSKTNAWNESGIVFAAFSVLVSDLRINS